MSVDYSAYCGPAIICKPKEVWNKKSADYYCLECNKNDIRNLLEEKPTFKKQFCKDCGAELKNIKYKEMGENCTFYVTEQLKEKLYSARNEEIKDHIYLSNINFDDAPRKFSCDISCSGQENMLILDSGKIENEKLWFVEKFRKEIEWLKEYYGSDNVRIEFVFFTEVF